VASQARTEARTMAGDFDPTTPATQQAAQRAREREMAAEDQEVGMQSTAPVTR
jgi:hypothetical protein